MTVRVTRVAPGRASRDGDDQFPHATSAKSKGSSYLSDKRVSAAALVYDSFVKLSTAIVVITDLPVAGHRA